MERRDSSGIARVALAALLALAAADAAAQAGTNKPKPHRTYGGRIKMYDGADNLPVPETAESAKKQAARPAAAKMEAEPLLPVAAPASVLPYVVLPATLEELQHEKKERNWLLRSLNELADKPDEKRKREDNEKPSGWGWLADEVLRRQQEQIEKQKRELEELSRRQEELERGRAEMADKLTRSLVVLEREAYDAQKKMEQLRATRESFGQHLELLEAIDPRTWNPADLNKELSRALSTVDDARTEYSQGRSRLQAAADEHENVSLPETGSRFESSGPAHTFAQWLQIGLAFTLPLIVFGMIALLIFFYLNGASR